MLSLAASTRMALATGLCLSVHGCEDVNGGAVELSWKLRPASSSLEDKFVSCKPDKPGTGTVTHIRLDWEVGDQTGAAVWECTENHGVTGFELPEGEAFLRVTPLCGPEDGLVEAHPASYIAPAAEQRSVIAGDTISLGAVEIVVVVTDCADPSDPSDERQHCICE